jgi:hypothetical protein
MGAYASDRQWADGFEPQIRAIIGPLMVRGASFRLDTKEATDFIVYTIKSGPRKDQPVGKVAARLRRPGVFYGHSPRSQVYWGYQFTIRTLRDSGVETELSKIMNGFGDWYFYGHVEQRLVRHWMVLDLEIFRENEADPHVFREEQDNRDGTYFSAYDVRTFPNDILIATSETMGTALDCGIDAVDPLPIVAKPRKLMAPPDLQALVATHGGYGKITQQAWADYDAAMAEWKDRVRNGEAEIE